jgi:hypothetical protein
MSDAVADFECALLPSLREAERALATEYPSLHFNVGSSSVGSATAFRAHRIWLECHFPDAKQSEDDLVAVVFGVKHTTTHPQLHEAFVGWGSGQVEVELLSRAKPMTPVTVKQLAAVTPKLLVALRGAIQSRVAPRSDA